MNSQDKPPSNAVILVIGVSGSGKSTIGETLAKHLDCDFLEGDDFHSQAEKDKMHAGQPLTDSDRWPWLDRIRAAIEAELAAGKGVVVACSGLRKVYRERLIGDVRESELVYLKGDPEMLKDRLDKRKGHFMPPSLLQSQLATLEEPGPEEHPITVSVHGTPDETLADVMKALGESV